MGVIYALRNRETGGIYVGSSIYDGRWKAHFYSLRGNRHCNQRLQNAWNIYGESAFEVEVLEEVINRDDLPQVERKWLEHFRTDPQQVVYNKSGSSAGIGRYSPPPRRKRRW